MKCENIDCEEEAVYDICPFAEDVWNETRYCNCCKKCRYQCLMDV